MSKRKYTTLSITTHAGRESFMGDNTVLYVNINTHVRDADGLVAGIISSQSIHLSVDEAKKLISQLNNALVELGELETA